MDVSYGDDLLDVLKNTSFTIEPKQLVGIVGRTGAGKSTLTSVLFRLLELREGSVKNDGMDISAMKLDQLRCMLAIIPHDLFLFAGTLRTNIDIEGKRSDQEILHVLRRLRILQPEKKSPQGSGIFSEVSISAKGNDNSAASHGRYSVALVF